MKAIVVIDVPKNCGECPCFYYQLDGGGYCRLLIMQQLFNENEKSKYCPLKPMPYFLSTKLYSINDDGEMECEIDEYAKGYNACINEILAE